MLFLGGALFALRVLLRPLLLFLPAATQLGECRHLVGLFLEIEVVHLLFGEIDDLSIVLVQRGLAIALHDHRRRDAFPGALATEQVHHPPEHSRELDARLLVGANRRRAQYASSQCERDECANPSHISSAAGGGDDCTRERSHVTTRSEGAHTSVSRPKPRRSNRNPPSAGPPSNPAPHARL